MTDWSADLRTVSKYYSIIANCFKFLGDLITNSGDVGEEIAPQIVKV